MSYGLNHMQFSPQDIKSFKTMYKKAFNQNLDDKEAYDKATNLIRIFQLVYKPITQKEMTATLNRQKELLASRS